MVQMSKEDLQRHEALEEVAKSYIEQRRNDLPAPVLELFDKLELHEQLAWIRDYREDVRRGFPARDNREERRTQR